VFDARVKSPFWTGPLRSPGRLQNTFAHESFVDELAAHAKVDPLAYRLRHLRNPRLIDVLNAAAKAGKMGSTAVTKTRNSEEWNRGRARQWPALPMKAPTDIAELSPTLK